MCVSKRETHQYLWTGVNLMLMTCVSERVTKSPPGMWGREECIPDNWLDTLCSGSNVSTRYIYTFPLKGQKQFENYLQHVHY